MAHKQTLSVLPQIIEKNGFRQSQDTAPKSQRQMHEEATGLRRELVEARAALARRDSEAELSTIRARQISDQWSIRLHEADQRLNKLRADRDRELKEITEQLRYFEAHLRVEQSQIEERLAEKDECIREQSLRLRKLESRNAELQLALKEAWRQVRETGTLRKPGAVSSWSPDQNGSVLSEKNSSSSSFNGVTGSYNGGRNNMINSFNGGTSSLNSSFNSSINSLNNSFSAGDEGISLRSSVSRDFDKRTSKVDTTESQHNGIHQTSSQFGNASGHSGNSPPGYHHQDSGFSESFYLNTPNKSTHGSNSKPERKYSNDVYKFTRSTSIPEVPGPPNHNFGKYASRKNTVDDIKLTSLPTTETNVMHRTRSQPNLTSNTNDQEYDNSQDSNLKSTQCVSMEFCDFSDGHSPGSTRKCRDPSQQEVKSQAPGHVPGQAEDQASGRSESPRDRTKRSFLRPRDVKKKSQLRARSSSLRENQQTASPEENQQHKLSQSKRFFSFAF